jgi:anti-anti-sigma regulatory factor
MEITFEQVQDAVAVMHITGDINASNFMEVIEKAREMYNNPARNLILDMSNVSSISSTGVVGIHKIALIYSGVPQDVEKNENPDFTHIGSARKHVRLLNPQPVVEKTLEKSGMKLFFKIFNSLEDAIKSF